MELDEMKATWAALGARLDHLEAAVSRDRLRRARRQLVWTALGDVCQLVIAIACTAWVATFWIHHRGNVHLLLAGLGLHVYGVAAACTMATQLLLVGRTAYTDSVVVLQRQLASLRRFRAVASLALGLPWWLLWVPVAMVGAFALAGVDLYAASPAWVWGSLGVGAAGLALCLWIARRLASRAVRSPWLARMVDQLAGRGVDRARRDLDEVARFSRA
jgi:hypothetical protein